MISVRTFAWIAIAEAGSFLLLLVAMIFKHGFDEPGGVSVIGPIHGVLFIAYIGAVILMRQKLNWSGTQTLKMLAAGVIPVAGFFVGERMMHGTSTQSSSI